MRKLPWGVNAKRYGTHSQQNPPRKGRSAAPHLRCFFALDNPTQCGCFLGSNCEKIWQTPPRETAPSGARQRPKGHRRPVRCFTFLFSSFLFFVSRCQHFRPFCLHFRLKCRHPPGSSPLSLYYGKIPSVFRIPFHPTYRTFGVSSPSAETPHESTCLKASHSLPRECAKRRAKPGDVRIGHACPMRKLPWGVNAKSYGTHSQQNPPRQGRGNAARRARSAGFLAREHPRRKLPMKASV